MSRRPRELARVTPALARALIDFEPAARNGRSATGGGFGESQLEGAVVAFNMLAQNGVAYVADEVGMGKTYVALGVIGLLRHLDPDARVVVIAPRENIQLKWIKELRNFVRDHWRVVDNRVKSIQGTPARRPRACGSLIDFVRELSIGDQSDIFLRMTSFSVAVNEADSRKRYRRDLRKELPWIPESALSARDPLEFRDQFGRALNAVVPEIDLLVVDEAHNLKKGFGNRHDSTRNRVMALALGHPDGAHSDCPWYGPRVKRSLCLSATPFEEDYGDLARQLGVLGFGAKELRSGDRQKVFRVPELARREQTDEAKRDMAKSLLVRRVAHLRIAGEPHTKNMYRREWRAGGFDVHDEPMRMDDPRQRLVVGLVQKKVAEVLGDERFGNSFQIGMLSSFESFLESVRGQVRRRQVAAADDDDGEQGDAEATFDGGDQTQKSEERRGADTRALEGVAASFRERFGRTLPHPKLDATADALCTSFASGEKALVFVRRVATVDELAGKLDRAFDEWLLARMVTGLPTLTDEVRGLFERFHDETRRSPSNGKADVRARGSSRSTGDDLLYEIDDDAGGTEDFFSWFFRGAGPKGVLSGAAFQKNRLSSAAAVYSTLFEDDYTARLMGRPPDALGRLAETLAIDRETMVGELRALAWSGFRRRTNQAEGYPRLYVFESYQAAALSLIDQAGGALAEQARVLLHERFPEFRAEPDEPPRGFPGPDVAIGVTTFFTALDAQPALRELLWPDAPGLDFRERFRRSEQRRELLSAMARLGATYVDLYLLAIGEAGSFELRHPGEGEASAGGLAERFVALLDRQREEPGFHAFRELHSAAEAFDIILAVNFSEVRTAPLGSLAETFGRTLQHQAPVGRMSGRVNGRLVRQFRMPGFPIVLISTDVLQEGEDLHTFCRDVVHYGITWTPSAMEQRTGRVDRIGSLVQRRLDGRAVAAEPHEKIQVRYPHLADTVEVLQVRRVLHRLNRFVRLIHEHERRPDERDSSIDTNREMLLALPPPPPPEGLLESAFPVRPEWLTGELGIEAVQPIECERLERLFQEHWERLVADLGVRQGRWENADQRVGEVLVLDGRLAPPGTDRTAAGVRRQSFELELRSRALGGSTLIRCGSDVGLVDLSDQAMLDGLYELQRELGHARICAYRELRKHAHRIRIEASLLFAPETTQPEEIEELVRTVTLQADHLEERLLAQDAEDSQELDR